MLSWYGWHQWLCSCLNPRYKLHFLSHLCGPPSLATRWPVNRSRTAITGDVPIRKMQLRRWGEGERRQRRISDSCIQCGSCSVVFVKGNTASLVIRLLIGHLSPSDKGRVRGWWKTDCIKPPVGRGQTRAPAVVRYITTSSTLWHQKYCIANNSQRHFSIISIFV